MSAVLPPLKARATAGQPLFIPVEPSVKQNKTARTESPKSATGDEYIPSVPAYHKPPKQADLQAQTLLDYALTKTLGMGAFGKVRPGIMDQIEPEPLLLLNLVLSASNSCLPSKMVPRYFV